MNFSDEGEDEAKKQQIFNILIRDLHSISYGEHSLWSGKAEGVPWVECSIEVR